MKHILEKYATPKNLRHCFPKVPTMALSTTIVPNILGYIKKLFYFYTSTLFYKNPLDYHNITQIVNLISKQAFGDLNFRVFRIGIVKKAIVCIEKIEYIMALAAHVQKLLLLKNCNRGEDLILTFHSNIKSIV